MDCSTPGSSVLYCLLEFAQINVQSVMLCNHLILCCPLLLPSVIRRAFLNSTFCQGTCTSCLANILTLSCASSRKLSLTTLVQGCLSVFQTRRQLPMTYGIQVLLEHSYILVFTSYLWLSSRYDGRSEQF